jgi:UDP-N-acetylmuramyl pentapeptide phosphotransferase/UDP-N-acetylglucosamine-1-phosphate transferase
METLTVTTFAAPSIALVVALLVTSILRSHLAARFALDTPNERSLHSQPVPRTGGIGVLVGLAAGVALVPDFRPLLLWLAPLVVISVLDDVRGMPAAARLAVHLSVAVAFADHYVTLGWFVALALGVAIAWMSNLYNFMDGSDGLAGGMAVIGFGAYGAAAWIHGDLAFAQFAWCVAAASAGFLVFNFSPASIFLGDTGSIPLGFLAGALGALGAARELWSWWFPLVVFAPFIVDATITLVRRILRGEKVWQAHRDHYYQRLVRMGWSHRRTALAEYALMLGCALAAVLVSVLKPPAGFVALSLAAIAVAASMRAVDARWRKVNID